MAYVASNRGCDSHRNVAPQTFTKLHDQRKANAVSRRSKVYSDDVQPPSRPPMRRPGDARRPPVRTQYFGEVDVDAPLLKPGVGTGPDDYSKRSKNRYDSDFIWNTNWMDKAKADVEKVGKVEGSRSPPQPASSDAGSGFLSLTRVADLNDMSVDLSAKLREKPKPLVPQSTSRIQMFAKKQSGKKYSDPPTAREGQSWQRSRGYTKRGMVASRMVADIDESEADQQAEADRLNYEKMKQEYQLWTTATTVVCFAAVYTFYPRDISASYLIGALGGTFYLRLLTRSIDSIGATSLGASVGGAAAQPRFLVPVILVLVFNRYNALYAESMELQLQLLPMLAGFFTFKAAVLGKNSIALFEELSGRKKT